jgi:hypothetical protein
VWPAPSVTQFTPRRKFTYDGPPMRNRTSGLCGGLTASLAEGRWLLDRQIGRLGAVEDLSDVNPGLATDQAQNASQTHGAKAQGDPRGDAAADACPGSRAASRLARCCVVTIGTMASSSRMCSSWFLRSVSEAATLASDSTNSSRSGCRARGSRTARSSRDDSFRFLASGTASSNPSPSSRESVANLTFGGASLDDCRELR